MLKQGEIDLMQTAITQPAMLTMDTAVYQLLAEFGFKPDMVMGHSLGEYAALIAAGIMPFADALEASAARGAEMTKVSIGRQRLDGRGAWRRWMWSSRRSTKIDGYVVAANINSSNQAVIGGASKAVEQAIDALQAEGLRSAAHSRQPCLPHQDRRAGQRAAARGAQSAAHLIAADSDGGQRDRRDLSRPIRTTSRRCWNSRSPRPCSG